MNVSIESLQDLLEESLEKLELYAKRQGPTRMKSDKFSDGTRSNPNVGKHYPQVQSFASRVVSALGRRPKIAFGRHKIQNPDILDTSNPEADALRAQLADKDAELARLRKELDEAKSSRAREALQIALGPDADEIDALRAQLASAEARVKELEAERKLREMDKARHRAVTEAADAMRDAANILRRDAGGLREYTASTRLEAAINRYDAARSADLPSAELKLTLRDGSQFFREHERKVIEKYGPKTLRHCANVIFNKLNEVYHCGGTEQGKQALYDAQAMADVIVGSKAAELLIGADLPPHPDTERLDWLTKFATQPTHCTKLMFHNSEDMGYSAADGDKPVSITLHPFGSHLPDLDGKGADLRSAIDAARSADLPSADKGEPRCDDCAPEFGCWVNGNTCRKNPTDLPSIPVLFRAACSGLWYSSPKAAGTVEAVKVGEKVYEIEGPEPADLPPHPDTQLLSEQRTMSDMLAGALISGKPEHKIIALQAYEADLHPSEDRSDIRAAIDAARAQEGGAL